MHKILYESEILCPYLRIKAIYEKFSPLFSIKIFKA